MKEITLTVAAGSNFTPAGLMQRYAKQIPGVKYQNNIHGAATLEIGGMWYVYHHWNIDGETVTVYLADHGLNWMCHNCLKLGENCDGTRETTWTGCVHRAVNKEV